MIILWLKLTFSRHPASRLLDLVSLTQWLRGQPDPLLINAAPMVQRSGLPETVSWKWRVWDLKQPIYLYHRDFNNRDLPNSYELITNYRYSKYACIYIQFCSRMLASLSQLSNSTSNCSLQSLYSITAITIRRYTLCSCNQQHFCFFAVITLKIAVSPR